MAEDTRKNILEVDVVQSIDKTDTVLVNDSGSLKQVSVETLVSSGIPDQYVTESELTGKGYATTASLPKNTSDLTNDSGFITDEDIPEKLPNPQKIIFTGAVSAEYDGSSQQTINIPSGGGTGGGTTDYNDLSNKPQLNGVTLEGDTTLDDVGVQPKGNYLTSVPQASSTTIGGIKAENAGIGDTVPVKIKTDGTLVVPTYPESASAGITVKTMQNTDTAVTLPEETPYDLYIFPEMSELSVTIADENTDVHLFFDSGATATVFSLQAQDGERIYTDAYSIDANMRYEVSVLHNVAYIKGVSTGAA